MFRNVLFLATKMARELWSWGVFLQWNADSLCSPADRDTAILIAPEAHSKWKPEDFPRSRNEDTAVEMCFSGRLCVAHTVSVQYMWIIWSPRIMLFLFTSFYNCLIFIAKTLFLMLLWWGTQIDQMQQWHLEHNPTYTCLPKKSCQITWSNKKQSAVFITTAYLLISLYFFLSMWTDLCTFCAVHHNNY